MVMWDDLLNKYLFLWTVLIIKKTFKYGTITIEFFFASGYAFDSYRFFLLIFLRIDFASRGGAQDDDQWRVIARPRVANRWLRKNPSVPEFGNFPFASLLTIFGHTDRECSRSNIEQVWSWEKRQHRNKPTVTNRN